MRDVTAKEHRLLRAKAIECSSLVAMAVGKEIFTPHAADVLTLYRDIQSGVTEDDDPCAAYLISAWARMSKILGSDFLPYVEYVMQPLLKTAQMKIEVTELDPDEDSSNIEEEGWEVVNSDGQKFGIKTSAMEDKCTAYEMLVVYSRDLGPHFLPYLPQVVELVSAGVKFYLHEGIRLASLNIIPSLCRCLQMAGTRMTFLFNIQQRNKSPKCGIFFWARLLIQRMLTLIHHSPHNSAHVLPIRYNNWDITSRHRIKCIRLLA
jgi:hypothetical protein